MENLTHSLFGATLYYSGFQRFVPHTLPLWIIAANLPDIDVIIRVLGPLAYLKHHRGITHSIVGILLITILLASLWWCGQWLILKRNLKRNHSAPNDADPQPTQWWRLWIASLFAVGTHPLLDLLNNYGVRPFIPFDGRWFYGDLVFIADPWLWLILGGTIFLSIKMTRKIKILWIILTIGTSVMIFASGRIPLPIQIFWILSLIGLVTLRYQLVGRLDNRHGTIEFKASLSRLALVLMAGYLGVLLFAQHLALQKAASYLQRQTTEPITHFSVSPSSGNPFSWEVLGESENFFYFGNLSLVKDLSSTPINKIAVPRHDAQVMEALATSDGKVVADFCRYLLVRKSASGQDSCVFFTDGRYNRNPYSLSVVTAEICLPENGNGVNGK